MTRRLITLLTCLVAACAVAGSASAATGHASSSATRNVITRTTWGRLGPSRHTYGKRIFAHAVSAPRHHRTFKAHAAAGQSWSSFSSHVETWALDDCGEGSTTPSSLVRSWLTYAETNCGPGGTTKALSDCHSGGSSYCNVIQYLDTNWIFQQGSPPYSDFSHAATESWYQHVAGSGARVQTGSYGGGYLVNQNSPGAQSFFQGYARSHYDSVDGLMMDDQSSSLNTQLYFSTCGCKTTAEDTSDAALQAAHQSMSAAMTHSNGQPFAQIDNTLPANPYLPQGLDMLGHGTVHGLLKEGSPEYNGHLDPYYSTLLDEIA
jgi:hypothetical protein